MNWAFNVVAAAAEPRVSEALSGLLLSSKTREMAGTERGEVVAIVRQPGADHGRRASVVIFALMVVLHWSPHAVVVDWPGHRGGVALWFVMLHVLGHPMLGEITRAARR